MNQRSERIGLKLLDLYPAAHWARRHSGVPCHAAQSQFAEYSLFDRHAWGPGGLRACHRSRAAARIPPSRRKPPGRRCVYFWIFSSNGSAPRPVPPDTTTGTSRLASQQSAREVTKMLRPADQPRQLETYHLERPPPITHFQLAGRCRWPQSVCSNSDGVQGIVVIETRFWFFTASVSARPDGAQENARTLRGVVRCCCFIRRLLLQTRSPLVVLVRSSSRSPSD